MPKSLSHRRIAAAVSAVALLGGTGLGAAQAAQQSGDGSTTQRSGTAEQQRGKHQRPGMPAAALAKIAETLGVSTAQLKAAMDATRPAKPAEGQQRAARGADLAKALAAALGVETAKVQEILDANRPPKPANGKRPARGSRPPAPDHTKLVAALAEGLDLEKATVQAALDKVHAAGRAGHEERHTAMYAALAKELGLSADAVKAAFEANRPAPPRR